MSSTEDRLLMAAVEELISSGYRGATTRAIAQRAGVNEVTLFRRFGTKIDLMRAAVEERVQPFSGAVASPSDDVEVDLIAIATGYVEFVDSNPGFIARVLPELAGDPELRDLVSSIQEPLVRTLGGIVEHHQRAGRLIDEPITDALRAFMGPLAARALMAHLLPTDTFQPALYVRRYLTGRAP